MRSHRSCREIRVGFHLIRPSLGYLLDLIENNTGWLVYSEESNDSCDGCNKPEQLKIGSWKHEDVVVSDSV